MREQWKEELQHLKLSDRQREKMKRAMHEPRIEKRRSYVPIVLPAFIAVAALLLLIYTGTSTAPSTTTAAAESSKKSFAMVMWLTVSLVLVMANYALIAINVQKIKRWQHWSLAQNLKRYMFSWHAVWLVLIPLALHAVLWFIFLEMNNPIIVLQGFFTVLFLLFMTQLLLFFTRNEELAVCPHCGCTFTKKELRKYANKLEDKPCKSCEQVMYRATNSKSSSATAALIGPSLIILNMTGLHFVYVIIVGLVLFLFAIYVYVPYTIGFKKEQEEVKPLW